MNLRESYKKNKKKNLLSEVSVAGAAGTFVGQKGDVIDRVFAGPYHPEFGRIKKLLYKQVDKSIEKRLWTDDVTPPSGIDFEEVDWKYEYDEYVKKDNSKFINKSVTDWEYVDLDIKYDTIIDKTKENEKYVNSKDKKWKSNVNYQYDDNSYLNIDKSKFKTKSDKMQLVDIDIKYDKIEDKTKELKKFVSDTNDWKVIYNKK